MQHAHEHDHHHALSEDTQTATDPVCGMQVDPSQSEHRMDHDGISYVFCSRGCQEKFTQDPDRYLHPAPAPHTIEGGGYTCPMHPEVVQDKPGSCPKCGMALEPMVVTGEEEADPELRDMTLRFWISVLLTAPVVMLAMGHMV
jgi:Cu+-exporting ATPase